jgi:hypothetical protein
MVQAHHPFVSLCPTWLCDTFISSMARTNARLPAALGAQLLGSLGAGFVTSTRLTSKNDNEELYQREQPRLQWHSAEARECAKCFNEAAKVLPPALARCLQSLAHFTEVSQNALLDSLFSLIGPNDCCGKLATLPLNSSKTLQTQLATCG